MPQFPYTPSPLFPWVMGHIGDGAAKCQMMSSCQKDVNCQKIKYLDYGKFTKNKLTKWGSHILMSILISHMMVTKNSQSVHRKYFWAILMTFIFDFKLGINICKPHYVNLLFFVNLLHSPEIWHFSTWHLFDNLTSYWHFGIFLNLNPLGPLQGYFFILQSSLPSQKQMHMKI